MSYAQSAISTSNIANVQKVLPCSKIHSETKATSLMKTKATSLMKTKAMKAAPMPHERQDIASIDDLVAARRQLAYEQRMTLARLSYERDPVIVRADGRVRRPATARESQIPSAWWKS